MIKSELIAKIATKLTAVPEKMVADSVNHLLDMMSDALASDQRVEIRGFGSFSLRYRPPRNAHNPKTGEKVITNTKHSPHFKPGKELRERVDLSKEQHPITEDERE